MALDARVAAFLLGQTAIDEALGPHAEMLARGEASLSLPEDLAQRLAALGRLPITGLESPIVLLNGRARAVREAALILAAGAELPVLAVDFPALVAAHGLAAAWVLAEREAAFQPAALLLQHLGRLKPEEATALNHHLSTRPLAPLVVLGAEDGLPWAGLTVALPAPDFEARRAMWSRHLEALDPLLPLAADGLAGKFLLSAAQIADAVQTARGNALWRDPGHPAVTIDDLYSAARAQSTPILSSLAHKIVPRFGWDDIVLPADQIQQLREMGNHVEHHHTVYSRWGLERRLGLSQGLMALFAGPSGTGKTMAADILARALGLDLYRIDLSGVVSKYIGETEKNLQHIFNEAETSNAILFFDEADALFGKRSEVKDAHDRYANIETAYLLQKMEEYAGVVILATNLKMNLDEAFMRRMHFVVDFPMPEEDDRRRIWATALPPELPLAPDVDLDFMARKFRLAGGHIRNIVVAAAFLAAADGRVVGMPHLIAATRREFQKIGRMITASDFEHYYQQAPEGR
jgi:SpoVK/Ycf46/Vps4 family AAA+-type ATPase